MTDTPTPSADLSERAFALLAELVDPDDCWFDHAGGCQAHGFIDEGTFDKCPVALAKALLAARAQTPTSDGLVERLTALAAELNDHSRSAGNDMRDLLLSDTQTAAYWEGRRDAHHEDASALRAALASDAGRQG